MGYLAIPFLIFISTVVLETIFGGHGIPRGLVTTVAELSVSILGCIWLRRILPTKYRLYQWIPIAYAGGDFFYNSANYILQIPFANKIQSLSYIVPYLFGMGLLIHAQAMLLKRQRSRSLVALAVIFCICFFALNIKLITVPSLQLQNPPLPFVLKITSVAFTLFESVVVGLAACMLVTVVSRPLQMVLFGILFTHISDIAIRYQTVDATFLVMTVFENGWFLGLSLMSAGAVWLTLNKGSSKVPTLGFWKKELSQTMPLRSIHGFSIFSMLIGFFLLWAALGMKSDLIRSAPEVSSTLLIVVGLFSFAVLAANLLLSKLSQITLSMEQEGMIHVRGGAPWIPKEVEVIMGRFKQVYGELAQERDRVLGLSSLLAHDVRAPLAAMRTVNSDLRRIVKTDPRLSTELKENIHLLDISSKAVTNLADNILAERKRILDMEPVNQSIERAAALVQANHRDKVIEVDVPSNVAGCRVDGLTHVLVNLLNNAAEASASDQRIRVILRRIARSYVIAVEDKGSGIEPQVLKILRQGKAVTTKPDGNGIGMSDMLRWARRNGIRTDIQSATSGPQRGTKVILKIPA